MTTLLRRLFFRLPTAEPSGPPPPTLVPTPSDTDTTAPTATPAPTSTAETAPVAPPPKPPDMWNWLAGIRPFQTLIDIGANDGAFGEFLAQFLHVKRVFFFEPQRSLVPQIEARDLRGADRRIFSVALSDHAGSADFFENSNHPSSSLLRVSDHSKREFPQTCGENRIEVPLARLDDLLRDEDLAGDVFIKIDVQGVEDCVIRGGQRVFARAKFVMIEMSFVPFYDGQPLFEEVHTQLAGLGFRFVGMRNQIDSPSTGQPLFAHCLYHKQREGRTS